MSRTADADRSKALPVVPELLPLMVLFAICASTALVAVLVPRSAVTRERKVGAAGEPVVGPAQTRLALSVARVAASVPAAVTGEPPTEKMAGSVSATEVTVPAPVTVNQDGLAPAPPDCNTWPLVPGARTTHPVAPR